ncbi:MAG TPA: hypothetical protein VJT49_29405 [Amycolatopsis sp.]|uniref:hypothetical protein n=1 Tax=Amycolatopsis sp. TaxID=37632 RepID=UPI002B4A9130|nr:hypothetical protein [Amycolatopsis sp.]HKS49155.1 hypothetical protein [Amycolatopsis sp.]
MPVLAWARLRYRPARRLLVSLGVAAATLLPVLAEGSSAIAVSQSLRHGIQQLDPGERSLVVSFSGMELPGNRLALMDRETRDQLAGLAAQPARAELLFRQLADAANGSFFLGAVDDLTGAVRITSGRAPTSCEPQRCEVVVVGDGTPALDPALGLVIVGHAVRADPLLLTGTFNPASDAPLLLADGVRQAAALASLETFQRSYGWVTPIDLDRVQTLGVTGYLALSAQVGDALGTATAGGLVLTAPDDVLRAEDARAGLSARRFALLSGAATMLLFGFAAIGAIGLRRDHGAVLELLRRRGAPWRKVRLLTALESAVPVAAGTLAGVLAGGAVVAIRAAAAGLPAWSSALGALHGASVTILLGAAAAAVVVGVTMAAGSPGSPPSRAGGGNAAWRAVDVTVVAGLVAGALALARGAVTATALGERTDLLLLALPVLVVLCGGLLVARIWPPVTGFAARLAPRGALGVRLGLLGVLRRPLRPVATVAFLTAATGIVVFAGAYQATLRQGAADQAAFAVPLDARITTGASLKRPLDVVTPEVLAATGATAHPVLRTSATARVNAAEAQATEVVGVDPTALAGIRSWDHVVGQSSPAEAARLISAAVPPESPGLLVPAGARTIAFPVPGDAGPLDVVAWLRTADGRDTGLQLRPTDGRLVADVPATSSPARLFALTIAESTDYATRHQHHIGESDSDVSVLSGVLTLGAPEFPDTAAQTWIGWGSGGAQVTASGSELKVSYQFSGARIVVRADAGATPAPIPVLADPDTAATATGGLLHLVINGDEPLLARVAGIIPRFPATGTRFVVADLPALADALDAREPGIGSARELWLSVPDGRAATLDSALTRAPFDLVHVDLRQAREDNLAGDPVARAAVTLLTSSALITLLVAALAVVLLVVAERRDESAELYAWETDGVTPGTLRVSLFVRAAAVVAVAVPGGLLVGLALSLLTTRLVMVTAVGTTPVPPLALSVGPGWVAAVVIGGVVLGLAISGVVAATALRERSPRRPEESSW